jgi:hypothetical protein
MKHQVSLELPVISDSLKEKAARVKQHFVDNKTTYLVGAGCFAVGYLIRKPSVAGPVFNNVVAPVIENVPVFNNTVNNGGYARKIVRCLETDEMWPSMTKAAEAAGHTLQAMSKHIHGVNDHLDGLHYVIEAVTAS